VVQPVDASRKAEPMTFRALSRHLERLRGLLLTDCDAEPVALLGCSSIHTFGMAYPIDVAFVGRGGVVLEARRAVGPGRVLRNRRAAMTLERPQTKAPWLAAGDRVLILREEGPNHAA
jgi:hypothetical protein